MCRTWTAGLQVGLLSALCASGCHVGSGISIGTHGADSGPREAANDARAATDATGSDFAGADAAQLDRGGGHDGAPDLGAVDRATPDARGDEAGRDGGGRDTGVTDLGIDDRRVEASAPDAPAEDRALADAVVDAAPDAAAVDRTLADAADAGVDACAPTSCAAEQKDCDHIGDGCGGTLDCGDCTAPATCGGGGIDNVCGPPAGACAVDLLERLTIDAVPASPGAQWYDSAVDGAIPVIGAGVASGVAAVAWAASDDTVHITLLGADGARLGADRVTEGTAPRALVATADGVSVLVDDTGDRDTVSLWLVKFDPAGALVFRKLVLAAPAVWQEGSQIFNKLRAADGSSLDWTGAGYAAYYGTLRQSAGLRHQGDRLDLIDADGEPIDGGWSWGCSHSMEVRVAHNDAMVIPVCSTDGYPTIPSYDRIVFNSQFAFELPRKTLWTGVTHGGYVQLVGVVPAADGFWVGWTASRSSNVYPSSPADLDVAFTHVSNDLVISPHTWLTDTPDRREDYAQFVAYDGGFVAGWRTETDVPGVYDHALTELDAAGEALGPPTVIPGAGPRTFQTGRMFSLPDGGVAWAWIEGSSSTPATELQFARLRACTP